MSKLPLDVLIDILCCLPTKTLVRFRSLSKPFSSLIDSPVFIKLQLHHSIKTNSNRVLLVKDLKSYGLLYAVDINSIYEGVTKLKHGNATHDFNYDYVYGSCNGLLALDNNESAAALWNPSNGGYQVLPSFLGKREFGDCYLDGFGYDPIGDDYKVIRMVQRVEGNHFMGSVYSVKANSSRRVGDLPYCHVESRDAGVLVGAYLHWKVHTKPDRFEVGLIVAFDLVEEKFGEVSMPDLSGVCGFSVGTVGGCLAIGCKKSDDGSVEVWVMKEYGVKESWLKMHSFSEKKHGMICSCRQLKPLGSSMAGNAILLLLDKCRLVWFHLEEEKEEIVEIPGGALTKICANICVRSLLPLGANKI